MKNTALTSYTTFAGCGAKLGPGLLDKALCDLQQPSFPELLVDFRNADDAGVWKLNEETALVQTVDFFPPIVDDPFTFGRIAAANALSDVYAMGGRPITALSIVSFPAGQLDIQVLKEIMTGALDALKEAETALTGGHSVQDEELKFGLAVTGLVSPQKTLRNNRPRPGDELILTKPLGTGIISRARKAGQASPGDLAAAAAGMSSLNKKAAAVLSRYEPSACTDVTGFGLLGHACEMIHTSGCHLRIRYQDLELLPGVPGYLAAGLTPQGTQRNREYREKWLKNPQDLTEEQKNLLFDPQTSGGLLAAVPSRQASLAVEDLQKSGIPAFACGTFAAGENEEIYVF